MQQNVSSLILFCLFFCSALSAQIPKNEEIEKQIERYAARYQASNHNHAVIYTGKVQQPLTRRTESLYLRSRFLKDLDETGRERFPTPVPARDSYSVGNLVYDGVYYTGISMRLDLYRDELIVQTPNEVYGIILDPERVDYADLQGYRIVFISGRNPEYSLDEGYYQLLYAGQHTVLKKQVFEFNRLEDKFVHRSQKYYIHRHGTTYRVRSRKNSILQALGASRRDLDAYIRRNRIDIRRDMEMAVVQIVSEWERLNQQNGL